MSPKILSVDDSKTVRVLLARLFAYFAPAGGYRILPLKDAVVVADNVGFRDVAAEREGHRDRHRPAPVGQAAPRHDQPHKHAQQT
jgi:hypothetical protein